MTSEDFSEVYWYSGLQALFVTVFLTSVDFLSKNSYKSSSLSGYFDRFFSNHTVGCWNISFSCLSQIRSEKFSFASNVSKFLLYFFCATAVVSMPRLVNFSPCDPLFFVFAPLLMLIACWKTNFFRMFMANYWERNREREIFRLNRFPTIETKSYFLHCSAF